MTFLFRRLDPGFNSSSGGTNTRTDEPPMKFEDEVCHAFRILGYPLPISKTGIVAVGSPHTWPALIAAIDWLVDMLLIVEQESPYDWTDDFPEEELYDQSTNADRATRQFDEFLRKSLVAFLADDDEGCAALELELLQVWEKDNEVTDGYLASVDGEVKGMKEEVERLEMENEG
jgi:kinetochore protein NDC80